jgi:hypothetical protein
MSAILAEKSMLVRLNISQWSARKFDRKVTREIAAQYQTPEDAGRYNKALISMEMIKEIQKAAGSARTYHYSRTLPWKDEGDRILPAALFMEYRQRMQELQDAFWAPVKRLVYHYPGLKQEARRRLNGLYREDDYPDPADIEGRYGFNIEINPIPAGFDFRCDVQGEEIEQIKATLQARMESTQAAAMQETWGRLYKAVNHMSHRLNGKDPLTENPLVFRNSLVKNLVEICDILPAFNLTDDPNLEAIRREVEARLITFEPDQLRTDPATRELVGEDAREIADRMRAFMGIEPGPADEEDPEEEERNDE